ncbi:MAG: hypothetical protein ACLFRX_09265 [Gemmatimonadota bacterium]
MASTPLRVVLRYVEILDSKDFDGTGEFVFEFKASVPESGLEQTTRIPEQGHVEISDHPSMRKVTMQKEIFHGVVGDDETLVLEANVRELDRLSADDHLSPYRREFKGPAARWLGEHTPWDEGTADAPDPEQLGDWRFAFAIEEAATT